MSRIIRKGNERIIQQIKVWTGNVHLCREEPQRWFFLRFRDDLRLLLPHAAPHRTKCLPIRHLFWRALWLLQMRLVEYGDDFVINGCI